MPYSGMINPKDYKGLPGMTTGQSIKVTHLGCSTSRSLSITKDVKGFLFHCYKCGESGFLAHHDMSFRDRRFREAEKAALYQEKQRAGFDLPADFSYKIKGDGLAWLGSGGWTSDMIQKYRVGWSDLLSRVVFKVQPEGYVARKIFDDQKVKYLSKAPATAFWLSGEIRDTVCIVEDILSAGRVGMFCPAVAMLGTHAHMRDVFTNCKKVIVWTDNDKAGDTCRYKINKFLTWFPGIGVFNVTTEKDPKTYTNRQISGLLKGGVCV